MKKNISINISGIIFHIEEDGYKDLQAYLDSINKYFSTYEDSGEIIADIESRIAEIFLSKLDDQKQIIVIEDVKALIDTMGTIADFEAIEEDEPVHNEEKKEEKKEETKSEGSTKEKTQNANDPGKQRLMRDEKRRVVGGVAAGFGYYFSIDPIWIRLIMLVLLLNLFSTAFSGLMFLSYIILWIVIPGSKTMGDDEGVKKMFRNPESRVLGGVASGIAAYFGIDVTIVRLLFVVGFCFFFTGFILYIIFWMITPEAKSITEKMQMQGEPVTLSNIQQSVKKSLQPDEQGEETAFTKILLFPFRALSIIFEAIGKILGPFSKVLVDVLRVFTGIVLLIVGLSGMVGLIIATGVIFGLFAGFSEYLMISDFPLDLIASSFSSVIYVAAFIMAFMPLFIISVLGLSVIAKNMLIKAPLVWSVFGLWVVSLVTMAVLVPTTIAQFARDGDFKETRTYEITEEPVMLRVNYLEGQHMDRRSLRLRGQADSVFTLVLNYSSQGKTRHEAIENAKMITYHAEVSGGEVIFDSNFEYKPDSKFRGQDLDMTFYIPYGRKFKMENDMINILSNTLSRSRYERFQVVEENTWVMTEEGLECITCPKSKYKGSSEDLEYYGDREDAKPSPDPAPKSSGRSMTFDFTGFDEVDIRGTFNVYITQSDEYTVRITGESKYKEDVTAKKIGDVLEVAINQNKWEMFKGLKDDERLNLYISLPKLTKLKSTGFCELEIVDFKADELDISLTGGSSSKLDINVNELSLEMTGGSRMTLDGTADNVDVEMSGASTLHATELRAKNMDLKASGVSNARVRVENKLKIGVNGLSNVRYYGDPDLEITEEGGMSTVQPMR